MQPYTNTPKRPATAWRLAFFVAILGSMHCATACAQSYSSEYERALEDSLIMYEALKPEYRRLVLSAAYANVAANALRHENTMLRQVQRIEQAEAIRDRAALTRQLRRARAWGNLKTAGAATALYILIRP